MTERWQSFACMQLKRSRALSLFVPTEEEKEVEEEEGSKEQEDKNS